MTWSVPLLLLSLCSLSTCNNSYHFVNDSKTWKDAQEYCRAHYTDLATVHDQTDAERICGSKTECPGSTGAWIGLSQDKSNREWRWSQPGLEWIKVNRSNAEWDKDQPMNNPGRENCVVARGNVWHDFRCELQKKFICYNTTTNSSVVISEKKTWLGALQFCRQHHTDLIGGPQLGSNPEGSWIGLFSDSWRWSDGDASSFRNWDEHERVLNRKWNPEKEQCAKLDGTKKWETADCQEERAFICYDSLCSLSTCNNSYHFVNDSKTWKDAQEYCRAHYTDLATVHDQTDAERICGSKTECPGSTGAWIGLYQDIAWRWSQPGLEFDQSNAEWDGNEPSFPNGKPNCGAIRGNKWHDFPCEHQLRFICYNNSTKKPVMPREKKSWLGALHFCRQHHTDLIGGPQLESLPDCDGLCWIGLFSDSWRWSDGDGSSFRNWDEHESVLNSGWNPEKEQCAKLDGTKQWETAACQEERAFICYDSLCSLSTCNYSYHFVNDPKTWKDAQEYCRAHYTDLATVHDQTDAERICGSKTECPGTRGAWIGLSQSRAWRWSQPGLEFDQSNAEWGERQPNHPRKKENCVATHWNKWRDLPCEHQKKFICYNTTTNSSVMSSEKKSWLGALQFCRQHHTDLIGGPQLGSNPEGSWIGLFSDSWRWSDGDGSSFRNWDENEPVLNSEWNPEKEQCAKLNGTKKWETADCQEERAFICYDNQMILIRQNKTFDEAMIYCRRHHGDLAVMANRYQRRMVQERANMADTAYVWVGLHFASFFEEWIWVEGTYLSWGQWDGGEPRECGLNGAMAKGGKGKWFGKPAEDKYNFVCSVSSSEVMRQRASCKH